MPLTGDFLLAVGTLAGAVTAAFGTVYAGLVAARRERSLSANEAWAAVVEERRQLNVDMRAELVELREEVGRLRHDLRNVRTAMTLLQDERDAAVAARDMLLRKETP